MYGYDGNMSALEWAMLCTLEAVSSKDQQQLIEEGYFLPTGELMISNLPEEYQTTLECRMLTAKVAVGKTSQSSHPTMP